MAEEFWKSSPFGEDSIFHPSWEEKQKQSRLEQQKGEIIGIFIEKGDYREQLYKNNIIYDNLEPAKYRPPVNRFPSVQSDFKTVTITVSVTVKGYAESVYISVDQNKQRATKQLNKYNAVFNIEIPKKEGKKQFELTAQATNFIGNEFFDTKKLKITIDLSGEVLSQTQLNEKKYASDNDWKEAAKQLNVTDFNLLKAIAYQESFIEPFLGDGHTKILYERHRFYELYKQQFGDEKANKISSKNPDIVNKKAGGYGNEKFYDSNTGRFDKDAANDHQFKRLEAAIKIDKTIAIKSTSFGVFQLLGEYYNYSTNTIDDFFNKMETSEVFQINATVNFLKKDSGKKGFSQALNAKNWELIASIYNGKNWKAQNPEYAKNIEKYYTKKPWEK